MLAGILHEGSGLGDQLFRYITVRTLAEKKGFKWLMMGEFKGKEFMPIETGLETPIGITHWRGTELKKWNEKEVRDANGVDIRSYDPEIMFVEDNTIIDGSFEDSKYWHHNLANISKWLAVEPLNIDTDTCLVGFRGGEYAMNPDLFLTQDYYEDAIELLPNQNMQLQVHTDDVSTAIRYFHSIPGNFSFVDNQILSHSKHTNMGFNWRSARYAKYAIIPNSAFFVLPRLLKHFEDPTAVTIAPRYWARRNTKTWARPACYYEPFTYI